LDVKPREAAIGFIKARFTSIRDIAKMSQMRKQRSFAEKHGERGKSILLGRSPLMTRTALDPKRKFRAATNN
jgi:hypothetical protein